MQNQVDKCRLPCIKCKLVLQNDEEFIRHMKQVHIQNVCENCSFHHRNQLIVRRHQRFCNPVNDFDETTQWL